jgi:glutathione S-transferase
MYCVVMVVVLLSVAMSVVGRMQYFFGRGRAETVRWLLAATGEAFENRCLSTPEELDALRASGVLAMGQLPLLEIGTRASPHRVNVALWSRQWRGAVAVAMLRADGLNLVQSGSMVRYLGQKHGLAGANVKEQALVDMVYESSRDFAGTGMGWPWNSVTEESKVL